MEKPLKISACILILILSAMFIWDIALKDKGPKPIPGSKIMTIEVYGRPASERIGVLLYKDNPGEKFSFIATSEILDINSFNKVAYEKNHPGQRAWVERDTREGKEVVYIFTNNPEINISRYCK